MEKFEKAKERLAKNNGAIQKIVLEGGEKTRDGKIISVTGRVFLQGMFKENEVEKYLNQKFEELGVNSVSSDVFEKFEDTVVTYISLKNV